MNESTVTRTPLHGTIIEYVTWHCRCDVCRQNWEDSREIFWDSRGRSTVPADAVGEYLRLLLRLGFTRAAIAQATGLSEDTIASVERGNNARVHRATAEKILALDTDRPIPCHKVPNHIVKRMLDEMQDAGVTLQFIYRQAGISPKWKGSYSGQRVSYDVYCRIKRVYDAFTEMGAIGSIEVT